MKPEMEYIYAVYQEGSISKAAEKLFMTQPALSIAIRRVETELGAPLFDRGRHPLKLTNVGEIYIQKYHQIRLLEKELVSQVDDLHQLRKGELLIGGTHFILSYIMAPVLSEFSSRYPNVDIRLRECGSDQLDDLLLNGQIDLCLKCDSCAPPLTRIDYAFQDHVLLAVPKGFVSRFGLPETGLTLEMVRQGEHLTTTSFLSFEYLSRLPYIILTPGNNLHQRFVELFESNHIEPSIRMQIEQIVTAYHLADSEMGATLTSAMIIKKSTCRNMVYYRVDSPLMVRDFYAIGRHKRYISNANLRFVEMLKNHYS